MPDSCGTGPNLSSMHVAAGAADTGKIVAAAMVPAAAALAVVIALAAWMMQHMRRRKRDLVRRMVIQRHTVSGSG